MLHMASPPGGFQTCFEHPAVCRRLGQSAGSWITVTSATARWPLGAYLWLWRSRSVASQPQEGLPPPPAKDAHPQATNHGRALYACLCAPRHYCAACPRPSVPRTHLAIPPPPPLPRLPAAARAAHALGASCQAKSRCRGSSCWSQSRSRRATCSCARPTPAPTARSLPTRRRAFTQSLSDGVPQRARRRRGPLLSLLFAASLLVGFAGCPRLAAVPLPCVKQVVRALGGLSSKHACRRQWL